MNKITTTTGIGLLNLLAAFVGVAGIHFGYTDLFGPEGSTAVAVLINIFMGMAMFMLVWIEAKNK